jgi:hypothetical protein
MVTLPRPSSRAERLQASAVAIRGSADGGGSGNHVASCRRLEDARELHFITAEYRNRAAHLDELSADDFQGCKSFVIRDSGLLPRLISATSR